MPKPVWALFARNLASLMICSDNKTVCNICLLYCRLLRKLQISDLASTFKTHLDWQSDCIVLKRAVALVRCCSFESYLSKFEYLPLP